VSRYDLEPLDLSGLHTKSIHERAAKVGAADLARPYNEGAGLKGLLDSLPRILAAESLRDVVEAIFTARSSGKPVVWGLGGHVIKCGLAPVLLDLMRRGYASAFALNGAAAIHDFEIAIAGDTSEDVESVLPDGSFGTADETGREMNAAISCGAREGVGIGESLGKRLSQLARAEFAPLSLLVGAYLSGVPVTVHVAIGTDTPHTHPAADGAAIGAGTHHDFRLFCRIISSLDQGGVYVNVGSAVLLPEVFLKAVSVVRNLGLPLREFTTVNMDFIQHYRPTANVLNRPHAKTGGRGYALTGHHEIMLPLLAAMLIEVGA
jgi:hypothetical protein